MSYSACRHARAGSGSAALYCPMWKFAQMFRRYRTTAWAGAPHGNVGTEPALSSIFSALPSGRSGGRPAPVSGTVRVASERAARRESHDPPTRATHESFDPSLQEPVAPEEPDERIAVQLLGNGSGTEPKQHMSRPSEGMRGSNGVSKAGPGSTSGAGAGATTARESLVGKIVCPFCGQQKSASSEPCPRCTMEDTPATRQATKARIGPWYVLQNRSPSAPGMKYATLLWLVNKGHVTPRSVVRGPTTYQLWRYAAHVRGLSREFGLCYSCGGALQKSDHLCAHCERPQDPPVDPDVLLDVRDGAGQLRTPVMREVEPPARAVEPIRETPESRDVRAATEARRTPPPTTTPMAPVAPMPAAHDDVDDDYEDEEDEVEQTATVSARAEEPRRGERPSPHSEMIVRPRPNQDLARTGGRMVSATHLAAALQDPADDAPAPRSRRWSALNVILFLLLLCTGAGAAVLYFKPEYREPTAKWASGTWNAVRTKLASMQWSSPPGEPPAPQRVATKPAPQLRPTPSPSPQLASDQQKHQEPARQAEPPAVLVAKSDPPKVEPRIEPTTQPSKEQPKREAAPAPAPATQPLAQPQLARDTTAAPPVKQQPQPQAQPQPQETSSPPRDDPARDSETRASEPPTLEQAMESSRKLYGQAIDAEARNDYAAALRFYEQIKKLRRDAWPGGLQVRIDLAREALKGRSAKSE